MSELNTEAEAESLLLNAVMGPDTHDLDDKAKPEAERIQENTDIDREEAEPEVEAKEQDKAEPEAAAEDEIEIPGEDGAEPTRLKLAEVLDGYREFKAIEARKAEVIERVEREATERVTTHLRQVEHFSKQTATQIQAAMQVLQPPRPPSADALLDPSSPQYDPDRYHREFARYQGAMASFQQAQGVARDLLARAEQAASDATAARETAELNKLQRAWPEFRDRATIDKFVSDAGKEYGYTPDELDASLTDHRNALVLRDALAFRAMKATGADVKQKVEKAAPKLVRSKQEAKSQSAQARDTKGQYTSDALSRLRKSHSDDDAAAFFAGLVKSGRI